MTFTQTSDAPYDRHRYKVVHNDGKELIFDSWAEAQAYWFHRYQMGHLKFIVTLDQPTKGKGF